MTFEVDFKENNSTLNADFGVLHIVEGEGGGGADGFSPIATVEQTDEGATITITDKNGTTTAKVYNGEDGQDGEDGLPGKDGSDGQDGVSCTHSWGGENGTILTIKSASGVSSADLKGADGEDGVGISDISYYENTESGGVNQLNINMTDGKLHNFYIRNGEKGDTGEKGEQGLPGTDGKDGHTPIKGEDYWTEADKAEIRSYVETTPIETITSMESLETNKVYMLTAETTQTVKLPSVDASIQNQILVYFKCTQPISVVWGGCAFVNKEISTIDAGCYRIIFEYNPLMNKWVVGVIQDGVVN